MNAPITARYRGGMLFSATILFFILICVAACSPSSGYQVIIENQSDKPVKAFTIQIANDTLQLGNLDPGESIIKQLEIKNEGSITYSFKIDDNLCSIGVLAKHIVPGDTANRRIIISNGGKTVVVDNILDKKLETLSEQPGQEEGTLPCMIPG